MATKKIRRKCAFVWWKYQEVKYFWNNVFRKAFHMNTLESVKQIRFSYIHDLRIPLYIEPDELST